MKANSFLTKAIVIGLVLTVNAANVNWWVRPIIGNDEVFAQTSRSDFQLEVVRCDNNHLTGLAVFTRYLSKDVASNPSTIVAGIEANEHRFWPNLIAEASNNPEAGWRTIGQSGVKGTPATRRVVPFSPGETFFVNMDGFRPLIGKTRYGRLVLENGQSALFLLQNLQPPRDSKRRDWTREPDEMHPSFTSLPFLTRPNQPISPISLLAVFSDRSAVKGEFSYGAVSSKTERPNLNDWASAQFRNSWPTVTAQVTNDDRGEWKTIGQSSKPDRLYKPKSPPKVAELLYVDLSLLRPLIGKYRYGRVILETGESAIFELVNLLPPEK